MENYSTFTFQQSLEKHVTTVMKRVFIKMTLALVVTGFVAMYCAASDSYYQWLSNNSWAMWAFVIGELGIVLGLSAGISRMSSVTASLLFYVFAVLNGLMLSTVFLVYELGSIAETFFITAGTFGAMAVYGYLTNRDLSKFGSILFMALIGLIICTIVNFFVESEPLHWIISGVGVLIFIGLTAWDVQKIKQMAMTNPSFSDGRLATLGALSLYLDFVNLFLYLLRFFGDRD